MKKLFISIIAVVCCMTASAVGTQPITGDGSKASPYQIATLDNLLWFADYVNGNSQHESSCAILTADITMNMNVLNSDGSLNGGTFEAWTPIGGHGVDFSGEFNGNGHTISGLYFKDTNTNNVGLFGKLVGNAHIYDLGVKDSYFYGKDHVGGICGDFASGRIENCWNAATVTAEKWNAGGISGSCWIYASIKDCYNIGKIYDILNTESYGGICGAVYENTSVDYTISNCYSLLGKCPNGVYGSLEQNEGKTCPASKINHSFVKTESEFANGEVCYKLNHGVTDGSQKWYQTLESDQSPVLNSNRGVVFYGYDGDVLKYSNSKISVSATHREVCAATCSAFGYSQECWEDTKSGRFYAEEACAIEINPAYVITYSPVMTVPEYDCNLSELRWSMKDENVTYDGVTFISPLEKVYSDSQSYFPNGEYVWFIVKDASAKNVRLKWHLDKTNSINGKLYYKINDGSETEINFDSSTPEIWVQNLPDLKENDKVTIYYNITRMWNFPLTWTMSLEYCPGHSIEHVAAKAATCTEKGNYEYWYCSKCKTYFADAECTTVMNDWEIPAFGHNTEYRAQKDATCTEDGYTVSHWHCSNCNLNYSDEACTNQITDDVVLPKIGHKNKQHHDHLEATCLTDGNIQYWYCPDCNKNFTDEACTASTTEITLAALGHDFTYTPYKTSTCTSEGDVEHWHCNRCKKDFNIGEQMASEEHVISGSLIIPCKESDAIVVGLYDGKIYAYDDCHMFTPPTEGEDETLIATVTFDEETVMMEIENGEKTAYSLNATNPLETFFAHSFKLTANQDPDHKDNYYSTFFTSECAYKLPADGSVKAYIGTLGKYQEADVLNLTKTDTIHTGEAVILRAWLGTIADKQVEITLMPSCNRRAASPDNKLTGTDVAIAELGANDYALTLGQNGVGFYNWSGRSLGAHKAYLRLSGNKLTSPASFGFIFDDGTVTGIGNLEIPLIPDATGTYNLNGIPVDGSYDGIVIKNGKKYISNGSMR